MLVPVIKNHTQCCFSQIVFGGFKLFSLCFRQWTEFPGVSSEMICLKYENSVWKLNVRFFGKKCKHYCIEKPKKKNQYVSTTFDQMSQEPRHVRLFLSKETKSFQKDTAHCTDSRKKTWERAYMFRARCVIKRSLWRHLLLRSFSLNKQVVRSLWEEISFVGSMKVIFPLLALTVFLFFAYFTHPAKRDGKSFLVFHLYPCFLFFHVFVAH